MRRSSPCHSLWLPCFPSDADPIFYDDLLNEYDAVAGYYSGWSLTEIRSLTARERREWISRALRHLAARQAALT